MEAILYLVKLPEADRQAHYEAVGSRILEDHMLAQLLERAVGRIVQQVRFLAR